ncbi:MAG: response regulator [Gammaproteobacteria bacterium]|nr:response regulator [Gammaproteobacteria bacterium]
MSLKRVLFVDEHGLGLSRAIEAVYQAGYQPSCSQTASEAWEILNNNESYDAVVVSETLPDMGGVDLIEKIKQNPMLAKIPIILETSSDDAKNSLRALQAGAMDFIHWPLEKNFLIYLLDSAVNKVLS